jgi:hypothetical protein
MQHAQEVVAFEPLEVISTAHGLAARVADYTAALKSHGLDTDRSSAILRAYRRELDLICRYVQGGVGGHGIVTQLIADNHVATRQQGNDLMVWLEEELARLLDENAPDGFTFGCAADANMLLFLPVGDPYLPVFDLEAGPEHDPLDYLHEIDPCLEGTCGHG